jgi:uncharacterized protein
MQGIYLKIFVPESLRYEGYLLHEWIMKVAEESGVPGGSAIRAMAGYGRHGHLHQQSFFELAGDLPVILEFFADESVIASLLQRLKVTNQALFYIKLPAEAGKIETD